MKVRIKRPWRGHKINDVISVTGATGQELIRVGYARQVTRKEAKIAEKEKVEREDKELKEYQNKSMEMDNVVEFEEDNEEDEDENSGRKGPRLSKKSKQ